MWIFTHHSNGTVTAQNFPRSQQNPAPMDTNHTDAKVQCAAQRGFKRPAEGSPSETPSTKRPRSS